MTLPVRPHIRRAIVVFALHCPGKELCRCLGLCPHCCNCPSKRGPNREGIRGRLFHDQNRSNRQGPVARFRRTAPIPAERRATGQETQTMRDEPAKTASGWGHGCAAWQAILARKPGKIPQRHGNDFTKTGVVVGRQRGDRSGAIRATEEGRPLSHSYLQETIESNESGEILARRPWRLWKAKPYEMQGT
jgi:hypothetical protein